MTNGVCAAVLRMQSSRADAIADLMAAEAERDQLVVPDGSELPSRKRRDRRIDSPSFTLGRYTRLGVKLGAHGGRIAAVGLRRGAVRYELVLACDDCVTVV